jgi:hypothetical protein
MTGFPAPTGLQAHNYWDNKEQFITQLAELLKIEAADVVPAESSFGSEPAGTLA